MVATDRWFVSGAGAVGGPTNNLHKGKWEQNEAFDIQSMNTVDMILANMKKVRMALDH
jgi:hypothetical protein